MAPVFEPINAGGNSTFSSGSSTVNEALEQPRELEHRGQAVDINAMRPDHDGIAGTGLHAVHTRPDAPDTEYEGIRTTSSPRSPRPDVEVRAGDRAELQRIASNATIGGRRLSTANAGAGNDLQRRDTYADVGLDDPALDPNGEKFDAYKFARVLMRMAGEKGVKILSSGFVWKDLRVTGTGSSLQYQQTVGSVATTPMRLKELLHRGKERVILKKFEGVVKPGELLVVLGRPGSGCSTFLKTVMGETYGLKVDPKSVIHYDGIEQHTMVKHFKGELVYNQEVDKHFPHLTTGQTLEFAARVRTPQARVSDLSREERAKAMASVVMAIFGLSHTRDTRVGNEFVRGVSGGERKRVSIAEMALAGSPLAAWDNSTRGLDSATALEFTKALRMSANITGSTHLMAIYQASQAIYDTFDKAIVLYEGRQIYFGPVDNAKQYFIDMGYECPSRQTTGDFLTSVTNPVERNVKPGYEKRVPRTPDDFEAYWLNSEAHRQMTVEVEEYERDWPVGGPKLQEFYENRKDMQSDHMRPNSPYTVSVPMQIKYLTVRAYQRLWNDRVATVTQIIGQTIMALIIGSLFYNTPNDTNSFFQKGGVLFFAVLLNALMAINEINKLYDQRTIVEKHHSYRFYHPFAEAVAGIVADIPVKFAIATCFNLILYFLAGLRSEPGPFFIFFLFNFVAIFTMSMIFRTIAATTKTTAQAHAIAGVTVLAIIIYTGYVIPVAFMKPWFGWLRFLNPIFYTFEALLVNELHGQRFLCNVIVPAYPGLTPGSNNFVCAVPGAVPGQDYVDGDRFLESAYQYSFGHLWRNFGILIAFTIGFFITYLIAAELNSSTTSTAEVLVFRRGHAPKELVDGEESREDGSAHPVRSHGADVEEKQDENIKALGRQTDIFSWKDVCYTVPVKGGERKLLDDISGWVKPGTLTALMGASGAGKTTLLNVLAERVDMGVITGDMLVSGKPSDASFQRKTGYVQQQDLHLDTTTVREALRFSAHLRQSNAVSVAEKNEFVEDVIKMLSMENFAEAVVGVPGEGLNVEQRKLLTIGVELAAKPALLLFLDEPTSGLDSQSSWAIVAFLRKLADNGQAVLATIHQPSAVLFEQFDNLLLLAKGGKTVYFGDLGRDSQTLLDYFERNDAPKCDPAENPAEYMLNVINGKSIDWPATWLNSPQRQDVYNELDRLEKELGPQPPSNADDTSSHNEFAMPLGRQIVYVTQRVFAQYWRMPEYIYSKFILGIVSALFISFSFFHVDSSQQGLQNAIFSIFMMTAIVSSMV